MLFNKRALCAIIALIIIVFIFAGGVFCTSNFTENIVSDLMRNLRSSTIGTLTQPMLGATSTQLSDISSQFITSYFYNQNYAFHYNNDGSCVLVAIELLLMYYNTFWDDSFVDESSETTIELYNSSDYMNHFSPGLTESANPNLFSSLHSITVQKGYYYNNGYHITSSTQVADILTEYLDDKVSLSNWNISSFFTTTPDALYPNTNLTYSQQCEQSIISLVTNKIPVIAIVKLFDENNNSFGNHACIAYYYDSSEQKLFYHSGWLYNTFSYLGNSNDRILGYVALLNMNAPHSHSNNYVINGNNVCSCALSNHQHKYSYTQYNNFKHKMTCYCGYTTYGYHDYVSYGLTTYCMYCGHIGDSNIPTPHLSIITPN